MDFLKKNWGLLIYSAGCLILAGYVTFRAVGAKRLANAKQAEINEQLNWFRGVAKDDIKLTKENERAAQDNRDQAERQFAELRRSLAARYRIDPRPPLTEVEAVRTLRDEILKMNRLLDACDPPVDYSRTPLLSFESRAASTELPKLEDVPRIFRQLRIIQEIVRIVAQCQLYSLERLDRPLGLEVIEEDLYTATPIRMEIIGKAEQIQTFINKITTEANYLFFLRHLALEAPDIAPGGVLGAAGGGLMMRSMGGGMEGDMGMEGMGAPAMRPLRLPRMGGGTSGAAMADPTMMGSPPMMPGARRRPLGGMGMEAEGMGMEGQMMPGQAAQVEPTFREDLRLFERNQAVMAQLRFDVIEFNQPEAEREE